MRLSKKALKKIIKEEYSKLISERIEATQEDAERFKEIMEEIAELVEEAFEISGRPQEARGYWYNGILARIDPAAHGMASRSYSMSNTYQDMGGGEEEDMMDKGYQDGLEEKKPAHPDNEFYMVNYRDGKREAQQFSRGR